jgi:hypothetical protein
MSAESTTAFYGVRFEIPQDEVHLLELRTHPLVVKARQNGLKFYWGNFAPKGYRYLLFIGDKLGVLGLENEQELQLSLEELTRRASETRSRLHQAGIEVPCKVYLEWQPDV